MRALRVPAAMLAVLLGTAALAGCAGASPAAAAHTAGSPEEFARLGLSPSRRSSRSPSTAPAARP